MERVCGCRWLDVIRHREASDLFPRKRDRLTRASSTEPGINAAPAGSCPLSAWRPRQPGVLPFVKRREPVMQNLSRRDVVIGAGLAAALSLDGRVGIVSQALAQPMPDA